MGEPPASGGCLRDWFTWICRYPRPPGGEGALAADLVSWAGSRGIAHTRDDAGNVLLGRGSGPILQAHLDMVDTDPGRGPLSWREQDGWICGQKRSLGADNGVGLALALDLLNREGPDSHWRALFTVGEEDGLKGARRVDPAWLNGSGLINLDAQEEGVLVDGSSGARDVHATLSFPQTAAHGNWPCWQLSLEGLPGGHSGLDIASPHRHPHAELARLLLVVPRVALVAAGPLGRRNALPREAWIRFRAPEAGIIPLKQVLASLDRTGGLDPRPALDPLAARQEQTVPEAVSRALLEEMVRLPHGVLRREGLEVESSLNWAGWSLEEGSARWLWMLRALSHAGLALLQDTLRAGLPRGAVLREGEGYPPWERDPDNPLALRLERVLSGMGEKAWPRVRAPYGLECAFWGSLRPELPQVAIGAEVRSPHSPHECVYWPSVERLRLVLLHLGEDFRIPCGSVE